MIDYHFGFNYCFHPVGQGLFASGAMQRSEDNAPRFQWVYDCGTSSSRVLVENGVASLLRRNNGRSLIDLVTISHFDRDHISGITALLSKFSVDTLMLPYMPLWQRLVIAFEEGVWAKQPLMEFFINPVGYFTQLPNVKKIARILFVLPSGQKYSPPPDPTNNDQYRGDITWKLEYESGGAPPDNEEKDLFETTANIAYLKVGGKLQMAGLWEFVPYNDTDLAPKADKSFREAVEGKKSVLLSSNGSVASREVELHELKILYDGQFGSSSEARNMISLFLYGGPIYQKLKPTVLECNPRPCPWDCLCQFHHLLRTDGPNHRHSGQCSMLYTGDGYLNTPKRLSRLMKFLGKERVQRVGVFQVMHHGAKGNWQDGVAKRIKPVFSIFSSDPHHKKFKHPDASVLRDFVTYGPVQVDRQHGATINGWSCYQY